MNVIQIVSDTFRRDYLGCYGNNWIHTKNLDALASDSIVFDNAYAASFPTIPNRTDLFTGKYTFIRAGWEPLPRNEVILSQTLRQAGYTTMLIVDTPHMIRQGSFFDRGFDGWLWTRGQESDRFKTNPTEDSMERQKAMGRQYLQNVSNRRFEEDYFVAKTMIAAMKWLELNYDQHDKFFLHVDTFDPHEPWDPPKWYSDLYEPSIKHKEVRNRGGLASKYSSEEIEHLKALYAGEVTLVDKWIGRLIQKIEDFGLFENTVIIFTTDHGTYLGEHGYIHKQGTAPFYHLYEENIHIPLIIRMPDSEGVKPGLRFKALVQPPDLMPTILDLTEAKIPGTVEGTSMLPLIRSETYEEREITLSSTGIIFGKKEYNRFQDRMVNARRMTVTSKEWVLIAVRSDVHTVNDVEREANLELYHLPSDPSQKKNIIDERKDIAEVLHYKMIAFLKSMKTNQEVINLWKNLP